MTETKSKPEITAADIAILATNFENTLKNSKDPGAKKLLEELKTRFAELSVSGQLGKVTNVIDEKLKSAIDRSPNIKPSDTKNQNRGPGR